jgi:hypothetical protein
MSAWCFVSVHIFLIVLPIALSEVANTANSAQTAPPTLSIPATPKDKFATSLEWFHETAEQGFVLSQTALGDLYYSGKVVEMNFELAAKWYKLAAAQNDKDAQFQLGSMYHHGEGVVKNDELAKMWFEKATEEDDAVPFYGTINAKHAAQGLKPAAEEGQKEREAAALHTWWFHSFVERSHSFVIPSFVVLCLLGIIAGYYAVVNGFKHLQLRADKRRRKDEKMEARHKKAARKEAEAKAVLQKKLQEEESKKLKAIFEAKATERKGRQPILDSDKEAGGKEVTENRQQREDPARRSPARLCLLVLLVALAMALVLFVIQLTATRVVRGTIDDQRHTHAPAGAEAGVEAGTETVVQSKLIESALILRMKETGVVRAGAAERGEAAGAAGAAGSGESGESGKARILQSTLITEAIKIKEAGAGGAAGAAGAGESGKARILQSTLIAEAIKARMKTAGSEPVPIRDWLISVNPLLNRYAEAFEEYGFEDTSMLTEATETDIEACVDELRVKKGHRRTILRAVAVLQDRPAESGERVVTSTVKSSTSTGGGGESLWEELVEEGTGRVYYHHLETGGTQWEAPPGYPVRSGGDQENEEMTAEA